MVSYYVILILVMFLVNSERALKKKLDYQNLPILLSMFILIFFAGLRDRFVGTDTNNYVDIFNYLKFENDSIFDTESTIEKGYLIIEKIALLLSSNYWSLLTLIAAICVYSNFYIIKKLSKNFFISIFIYLTLTSYLIFFNGARQGLAVSISVISIQFIINRNLTRFVICILIASLFHRTALILIPFYYILRIQFTYKKALLFLIFGLIAFYLFSNIITLFDSSIEKRYAAYENRGAQGGQLLAFFFISITAILIKLRKEITIQNLKLYDLYLNLCLFSGIIYIVVIFTGSDVNFIRITNYFTIGYILIWPIVFSDVKLYKNQFIRIIFIMIHLIFYGVFIYKMSDLYPYQLNSELYEAF